MVILKLFIDFKQAFDSIRHDGKLEKLTKRVQYYIFSLWHSQENCLDMGAFTLVLGAFLDFHNKNGLIWGLNPINMPMYYRLVFKLTERRIITSTGTL